MRPAPSADPMQAAPDELVIGPEPMPGAADEEIDNVPPRRRVWLPVSLFLLTCASTFLVGAVWLSDVAHWNGFAMHVVSWENGLGYMFAVMGILLAHEMGHFLMTVRYRVPASLPYFIPMPITPLGTMGAVIAMHESDRRQMFDIGLAGPIAGLLVAVPVLCAGIYMAEPEQGRSFFSQPLLTKLLLPLLRPDLPQGASLAMNPLLMAGWVGLLLTGVNMMPISQLDGGHVAYALLLRKAHYLAYAFLFAAVVYTVASGQMTWVLMLSLILLIGLEHPPTANDNVPLGRVRTALGAASLAIPVFCFPPQPFDATVLALLWM